MWLRQQGRRRDDLLIFGEPLPRPVSDFVADLALNDFVEDDPMFDCWIRTGPLGPAMRARDRAIATMWSLLMIDEPLLMRESARQPPFRDLHVAEVLLEESEKQALRERVEQSEMMARAALWITDEAYPAEAKRAEGLRLRSRCLLSNARRLAGDWDGAENWLRRASGFLGGAPSPDQAFFFQTLAALREAQGRLDECLALLKQAEALYLDDGRGRSARFCLARLGFVHLRKNEPGPALSAFTRVRTEIVPDDRFKVFEAGLDLGRAACLAAVGLSDEAAELLTQGRIYRRRIRRHDEKIKLEWLDCRIAVHLGQLEEAIPRLEAICRWLLLRPYPELHLCSLDLVWAYFKAGRSPNDIASGLEDLQRIADAEEEFWAREPLEKIRIAAVEQREDLERILREATAKVPPGIASDSDYDLLYRRYAVLQGMPLDAGPGRASWRELISARWKVSMPL